MSTTNNTTTAKPFDINSYMYDDPDGGHSDRSLVLKAIEHNGYLLGYASKQLCNEKDIALFAVEKAYEAFEFVGESLINDPDIQNSLLSYPLSNLQYLADWLNQIGKAERAQIVQQLCETKQAGKGEARYFMLTSEIPKSELKTYITSPMYDEAPHIATYEETMSVPSPQKGDILILEDNMMRIESFLIASNGEPRDYAGVKLRHPPLSHTEFLADQIQKGTINEITRDEFEEHRQISNLPTYWRLDYFDSQGKILKTSVFNYETHFRNEYFYLMYPWYEGKSITESEYQALIRLQNIEPPFYGKIDYFNSQGEISYTQSFDNRADYSVAISYAEFEQSNISAIEISESEYTAIKAAKQPEENPTLENDLSESSSDNSQNADNAATEKTATILDNENVKRLLSIVEANNISAQGLIDGLKIMSRMENQLVATVIKLDAVRQELADLKQNNMHSPSIIQASYSTMKTQLTIVGDKLAALKEHIITGCKNAVTEFEKKGIIALNNITHFLKIKPAMDALRSELFKGMRSCENAVMKIEIASSEYHEAGKHIQNVGRTMGGKVAIPDAKPNGMLAKTIEAPFKAQLAFFSSMYKSAATISSKLDRLEQTENRHEQSDIGKKNDLNYEVFDPITTRVYGTFGSEDVAKKWIYEQIKLGVVGASGWDYEEEGKGYVSSEANVSATKEPAFFGKIDYVDGQGTTYESALFRNKADYQRAINEANTYSSKHRALEISETEFLAEKAARKETAEKHMIIEETLTPELGGDD